MPAYCNNTVAELRQICGTRGIEHDGLAKTRLIAALREADVQQELARLRLAIRDRDLALEREEREARREEREWQIELEKMREEREREKERIASQVGSQSTRGTMQLPIPSEIYKVLPRMSSNDTDVLTFFSYM